MRCTAGMRPSRVAKAKSSVEVFIAVDIDPCGELAIAGRGDKEMDGRRPLTVPQLPEQLLGVARRAGNRTRGQDCPERVAADDVGLDASGDRCRDSRQ